jgi:glutaredoxin
MPTICPKCHYVRKEADTAPSWQCPSCHVAYSKVGGADYSQRTVSATAATGYVPQIEKPSHTWKWVLIAAVVVGVVWKSVVSTKSNSSGVTVAGTVGANGQPTVVMYSTKWCGACRMTRDFFNAKGVAYTEFDIEASDQGRQEYDKLGGGGIPLVMLGDEKSLGFNSFLFESRLGPWMKKLDN